MTRIVLLSILAAGACVSSDQLRRQQYDNQYQQAVQRCGHPDVAFQAGYNEGYAGNRMDGTWTSMCTPDVRNDATAAYQSGFLQGANNAPIRVVHTVNPIRVQSTTRTTQTSAAVSQCTFDSDCGGDGWHCREHTCRGFGEIGDQCSWNDECSSDHCFGGTCRE